MKIAVSSQNRKTITGHAGKCRKFWIYEVEDRTIKTKRLLELPREQSFHESHAGDPHPLDDVNVLISGGMGTGLALRLNQKGIAGLVTAETDPDQAIGAYLSGRLETLPPEENHGHDEHHH